MNHNAILVLRGDEFELFFDHFFYFGVENDNETSMFNPNNCVDSDCPCSCYKQT